MEKVLVKNQLCLKRLSMNGKQTTLAKELTLCCKSLDQRLFAQVMYVRLVHVLKSQQDLIFITNKRDVQSPPFGKSTW